MTQPGVLSAQEVKHLNPAIEKLAAGKPFIGFQTGDLSVQNARTMDYFANTNSYRAWAAVNIQTSVRTELLFSFHGLGQKPRGILACAAMAYRREPTETDETRIDDIQPLSSDLFEFTYLDEADAVKRRFRQWLEDCLVSGLEYWRKEL